MQPGKFVDAGLRRHEEEALTGESMFPPVGIIPCSRKNPKIRGIDDPEIIGDLIAVGLPLFGHFFAQESQHRAAEIRETGVAFVVGEVSMHQSP